MHRADPRAGGLPRPLIDPMLPVLAVIHGPVYGGAHNQLAVLREPLAERGIEIEAVLPASAETAALRLRSAGVTTHQIPLGRLRASPNPAAQLRFAAGARADVRRIRRLIGDRGAGVVQVHGVQNPQAALAARAEGGVGVSWQLLDTRAPMALRRATMPLVSRLSDSMTTWGEALADSHPGARRLGARRITVYPPVRESAFSPDQQARARARAELGVEADQVLVAAVGVRNPQKGHEWFVRAAALLAPRFPQARFLVIGAPSPSHSDHMAEVVGEAERAGLLAGDVLGFVDPGARVAELTQAIDVLAMSSVPRSEGMPTVILEAMTNATPAVATDVGATGELIEDGVSGLVVGAQDPEAMADAIGGLLADPARREAMGSAARERASRRFGLERLADLYAGAYELAASRAATRS